MTPADKETANIPGTQARCPWAIKGGTTLTTRCMLAPHEGDDEHIGRGLAELDYQRWHWHAGNRREFLTDRTDEYAWEDRS
jgi:hypothetical protein